jgi:hypothetical protein
MRSTLAATCVAALFIVLVSSFGAMPVKRLLSGNRLH